LGQDSYLELAYGSKEEENRYNYLALHRADICIGPCKAIEAMHAPIPEDLPLASSIRKMVEERRRTKRKQLKSKEQQDQGRQENLL
jgi:hypothetical protein